MRDADWRERDKVLMMRRNVCVARSIRSLNLWQTHNNNGVCPKHTKKHNEHILCRYRSSFGAQRRRATSNPDARHHGGFITVSRYVYAESVATMIDSDSLSLLCVCASNRASGSSHSRSSPLAEPVSTHTAHILPPNTEDSLSLSLYLLFEAMNKQTSKKQDTR